MIDALNTHGALKGLIMGSGRICRCHPLVKGGIDYVPPKFTLRRNKDETYYGPYKYRVHSKHPIQELSSDESLPWDLLLLAGSNRETVEKYIENSKMYVYREWNTIIGIIVVQKHGEQQYEIMNLAVTPSKQKQEIDQKLVLFVQAHLRQLKTPISLVRQIPLPQLEDIYFYEKCGFIKQEINENNFIEPSSIPISTEESQINNQVLLVYSIQ